MSRLVSIALEEFGPGLSRTRFTEVMLALFDQIAGLELPCDIVAFLSFTTNDFAGLALTVLWFPG